MKPAAHNLRFQKPVYLDYAATTPVAPEVAKKMLQCLTLDGNFANPASRSHVYGWQAEEAVEEARGQVAALINADPREIVWTSGATEANNLALKGVAASYREQHATGGHIVVSAIEHKAIIDPALWLERQGFSVTFLMPDQFGQIAVESVRNALREDTFLVSLMHVNNELGTINDIATLGALCRQHGCLFHTDAAQSAGKILIDVRHQSVDLLSLSAHKMYGPKGVGALFVRRDPCVKVNAQIHGGGHERGMRSGTLPTHQCVGMGEAAALATQSLVSESERLTQLRDRLWSGISQLPGVRLNGHPTERACSHLNVACENIDGEMLMLSLRNLAISTGSACNSASMAPSYVLKAIGLSDKLAHSSFRFSLGRYTNEEEIDFVIDHVCTVINQLQKQ